MRHPNTKPTYDAACTQLAKRDRRKIGNNTYLERLDAATVAVRLHATNVVKLHADGTYTLNSGGYQTVTTKDRINAFSPARLNQHKGIWFVGEYVFEDGIKIDATGTPINATKKPAVVVKAKAKLDKQVREYVKGFAADAVANGGLREASNGDCWGCLFKADGNDNPMGYDHFLEHFKEKYYVPSLLVKAIKAKGYANPGFIWHFLDGEVKRGEVKGVQRELNSYFRKIKHQLLKLEAA